MNLRRARCLMELVITLNLLLAVRVAVGFALRKPKALVSMMYCVMDADAMSFYRGCRILSQLWCCVDLFSADANFNVYQIRSNTFKVRFYAKAGGVGNVKEAGLVGNDVILCHRSSQ